MTPGLCSISECDARYRLTESLLAGERRYLTSVRAVEHVYGTPLRKLSSISVEEHRQLFTGIQPVCSVSAMLVNKVRKRPAVSEWVASRLSQPQMRFSILAYVKKTG